MRSLEGCRGGGGTYWKEREFMEILHSATTFVRRSKVAESWAVENRWMWQGIERMRESENSASSVNLAIKSHRSQLLWKSQWNYSRERQLLLHYQLVPLPPLHLYMPHLLYCYFPGSELEQGSPVLWQPVPPVHKESATNKLLFRAKKKKKGTGTKNVPGMAEQLHPTESRRVFFPILVLLTQIMLP